MTKAEEVLCRKMYDIGNDIMFKAEGRKWIFSNSEADITPERLMKFKEAGIGVIEEKSDKYFYILDDYEYINNIFIAKKDVVTSVPISTARRIRVRGKIFDLTNFCGVFSGTCMEGAKLIVGDDFRVHVNTYRSESYQKQFLSLLLNDPTFDDFNECITSVKFVGTRPIKSLHNAFIRNTYVYEIDFTEANLTECEDFENLCRGATALHTFNCGFVDENADVSNAFADSALPIHYNPEILRTNELGKINAISKKEPALFPVIDTPQLKIAVTNLSDVVMEKLFPGFTCKIIKYQGILDSVAYPYAFLMPTGVNLPDNTIEYLHINYPEIAENLTGRTKAYALGDNLRSDVF